MEINASQPLQQWQHFKSFIFTLVIKLKTKNHSLFHMCHLVLKTTTAKSGLFGSYSSLWLTFQTLSSVREAVSSPY